MTIVEKIKALFAKAASTDSPHEAEALLAKAHELMEKHQLDMSDLETDDPMGEEQTHFKKGAASPDWDHNLLFGVAAYFGCYAIECKVVRDGKWVGNEVTLVGRESARITAIEMHKYLVTTVRRLGREAVGTSDFKLYRKDCFGEPRWTGEYMNASQCARRIGNELRRRLHSLAQQNAPKEAKTQAGANALVTIDSLKNWLAEHHPNLKDIRGTYASNAGAQRLASGISLNMQTGADAAQRRLA